jgi:hypothetical protein
MKKLIIIAALALAGTIGARSQGVVDFANLAAGVNAPVVDVSSNKIAAGYAADLFYALDTGGTPIALSSMTDAGLAQPFLTGAEAGYFADGTGVTLTGSGQFLFEVVVWQTSAGASWNTAMGGSAVNSAAYILNGGSQYGVSTAFLLTPNNSPSPASALVGLTAFQLQTTPEPATFAIGGLGAAALLLFRRRK